jgi:hypothetical protein
MSGVGPGPVLRQIAVPRDQSFQDVYASQMRMSITVSDITIIFGVMNDRGQNIYVPEDRVAVRLAPVTAKVLLHNLKMALSAYESVLGTIPIPPHTIRQSETNSEYLTKVLEEQMAPPASTAPP